MGLSMRGQTNKKLLAAWQHLTILLHGSHHHVLLNDIPGPSNRVRCYLPNGERMRRCCRRGRPARRGPPGTSNNKNLHSQAMSLVFPLTGWEEHISHISVLEVAVIWRQACQIRSFQSTNFKRLQYQQIFPRKKLLFVRLVRTCLAIWAHLPLFKWQAGCLAGCHFV